LEPKFASANQISLKSDMIIVRDDFVAKKKHFFNGSRPPSWVFEIWYFGQWLVRVWTWLCFFLPNLALIRR